MAIQYQYVGASLVTNVEILSDGNYKIILSDGSFEYLTPTQWEAVKSEEPYPDGEISDRKWNPTIETVLGLFLDANMQIKDKEWVMQKIDRIIVSRFDDAMAKKWGVSLVDNISLQQVDSVLKSK